MSLPSTTIIASKTYSIQKVSKWTWQAFDEQEVKVEGCSGPSIVGVKAKLKKKFFTESGNPKDLDRVETTEEFIARGGNILECRSQRDPKPKATGLLAATKDLRPKKIKKSKKSPKGSGSKSTARPRVRSQEGVITLQEILDQFGIGGPRARKILRGSEIQKPGKQWIWKSGSKEHREVVDHFSTHLGIEPKIKGVKQ